MIAQSAILDAVTSTATTGGPGSPSRTPFPVLRIRSRMPSHLLRWTFSGYVTISPGRPIPWPGDRQAVVCGQHLGTWWQSLGGGLIRICPPFWMLSHPPPTTGGPGSPSRTPFPVLRIRSRMPSHLLRWTFSGYVTISPGRPIPWPGDRQAVECGQHLGTWWQSLSFFFFFFFLNVLCNSLELLHSTVS